MLKSQNVRVTKHKHHITLTTVMLLHFFMFMFWNYYVLKLLRLETITFSYATLSDINVVLCYVLSQYPFCPVNKGLLVLAAYQETIIQHILSVLAVVTKSYDRYSVFGCIRISISKIYFAHKSRKNRCVNF
jgi:hypothetical protein